MLRTRPKRFLRLNPTSASRDFPCADFSHVRLMPAFSNQSVEIQKPIGSNQDPLVNVIRVSKGECPIGLSRSRFGRSGLKSRTMALTRLWKDDFESSSFPFSYPMMALQNRVLLSPEKVWVAGVWDVEWLESVRSWQFWVSFLDVYMRVGCHQRFGTLSPSLANWIPASFSISIICNFLVLLVCMGL